MSEIGWLYINPITNAMIIKRDPCLLFPVSYINIKTGETDIIYVQGQQISVPVWDWVKSENGTTRASWNGRIFDITDYVDPTENPNDGKHDPK